MEDVSAALMKENTELRTLVEALEKTTQEQARFASILQCIAARWHCIFLEESV